MQEWGWVEHVGVGWGMQRWRSTLNLEVVIFKWGSIDTHLGSCHFQVGRGVNRHSTWKLSFSRWEGQSTLKLNTKTIYNLKEMHFLRISGCLMHGCPYPYSEYLFWLNISTLTLSNYVDWMFLYVGYFQREKRSSVHTNMSATKWSITHNALLHTIMHVEMTTSKLSVDRPPSPPSPPKKWQLPSWVLIDPPSLPPFPSLPT